MGELRTSGSVEAESPWQSPGGVQPPWNVRLDDEQRRSLTRDYQDLLVTRAGADLVWVQLSMRALCDHGRAVVFLPAAAGFRHPAEAEVRMEPVERDALEAWLGMPESSPPSTSLKTALWVLRPGQTVHKLRDAPSSRTVRRGDRRGRGRSLQGHH
jgi:hypothetical protein